MDAVFVALVIALPIIAVCVIAWWWIRHSATPAIAARRKRALCVILILPAALYMIHGLLSHTQVYRSITGISTVVLANNSGAPLDDVEIVMQAPNHHYTYRYDSLRPHRRERFALRAPELAVARVSFSLGPRSIASTNVVHAKRGEILTVRIDPSGKIVNEIN